MLLDSCQPTDAPSVVLGRDVDYGSVIDKSTGYINKHYDRSITLGDLATQAGCNSFQVIRAFRRVLGITPHSYIIETRLKRARELLALGQPAAEVAIEVGFFDQSHLIRHFKRRLGRTPRQHVSTALATQAA